MKKRVALMLTTMVAALAIVSGTALAESIILCSTNPCYGTDQAETMVGTNNILSYAEMYGKGGDDVMYGRGGADDMAGGPGKDEVRGGEGKDFLYGGADDSADTSSDYVYGGNGSDLIVGGVATAGVDHLYGGKGDDDIEADRASTGPSITKEVIDCGPGSDTVWFDEGLDVVQNCEYKTAY